jgi:hypothetical protein
MENPTNGNWGVVFQKRWFTWDIQRSMKLSGIFLIFIILQFLYKSNLTKKGDGLLFGIFLVLLFSKYD